LDNSEAGIAGISDRLLAHSVRRITYQYSNDRDENATHKDGRADVSTTILQVAPYRVGLDYRPVPGIAEVHSTTGELIMWSNAPA